MVITCSDTRTPETDTSGALIMNTLREQGHMIAAYHVVKDEPFRWGLLEGAKGVQLAEKGIESWQKRCWVDVPALTAD